MYRKWPHVARANLTVSSVIYLFILNLKHLSTFHMSVLYLGPPCPPHLMIRKDGIHDLQLSQLLEGDQ